MDRNLRTMLICFSVVASMTGLAYASVPFYQWFCQVTGFDGTTMRGEAPVNFDSSGTRTVRIRFDANVAPGLTWNFSARDTYVDVRVGETGITFYDAQNYGSIPTRGHATFNVTPEKAGKYFTKVACFCFTDQPMAPGEVREMPVNFFVDPAILTDKRADDIHEITLSYTFFDQNGRTAAVDADASSAQN
jgi:cytochrome c oxidase assembly protein subunit 11